MALLERAGLRVHEVVATAPPKAGPGRGQPRVIHQRTQPDGSVVLTVAYLEHEEAGES